MVRKNITSKKKNYFNINDDDIKDLVKLVHANRKKPINLSRNVFDVRQIGLRNRFNYNEYVY
jgi:hypothetical protein